LRSPWTVRVLLSMRTSMSFSSMPGTSSFRVMLCLFVDVHRRCSWWLSTLLPGLRGIRLTGKTVSYSGDLADGKLREIPTGQ
jgi:hypothetical protein